MQIVRKKRIPGRERSARVFEGLSDFSNLFTMFLIVGVAAFVLYAIALLAINLVYPRTVHKMDMEMTDAAVNTLMENRNFESAIALMEINPSYIEDEEMKIGKCYENVGEYGNALEHYLKDWNIRHSKKEDQSIGSEDDSEKIFQLTSSIIGTYIEMGDMVRAAEYHAIMEKDYSDSLSTLSDHLPKELVQTEIQRFRAIVDYQKNPEESIRIMRDAVNDILAKDNVNVNTKLSYLNQAISWEIEQGMNLSALADIHLAVATARTAFDINDFEGFGKLAGYCRWAGEYDAYNELMSLYRRHLRHTNKMKKTDAVPFVKYLVYKGRLYDAETRLTAICSDVKKRIESNLMLMSDEQREFYVKTIEEPFSYAEELLGDHPSPRLAKLVASNMLFKKGLLLRSNRNQRIAIEGMNDPDLDAKYAELISAKKELAVIKSINRPDQIIRRTQLQKIIYSLDKSLSAACSKYISDESLQASYDLESIQAALSRGDSFTYFAQNSCDKLFALQIKRKGEVRYFSLGYRNDIGENVYRSPDLLYGTPSAYERLVSPVYLPDKKHGVAYYTTSGLFNQISFAALELPDGRNLLDDVNLFMVSDPTSISSISVADEEYRTISLWGGIKYSEDLSEGNDGQHRGIKRGDRLVYLKGSLNEVNDISSIMSDGTRECNVYTSYDATEASFKNRDEMGDDILHISTHGFFNEDDVHRNEYDMMDNSGLFFAGAEAYWLQTPQEMEVPADGNDGILRSSEIELMNLNGCRLVVLSACETGLGYDDSSEGVYGLQRAFKLSGAEKIMMSLWEVPDMETSLLMSSFYKNLKAGDNPNEALVKAQMAVREQYPSPESWGGFVILN